MSFIRKLFTSALKGLVPSSGGGTTNYLRADGTWAAPPGAGSWEPENVDLGSLLTTGATFFIGGGAGIYLSFSGGIFDDDAYFNKVLRNNGIDYDGSDLAIILHWRLSSNGGGGDTVGWIVEYSVTKVGDNSATAVTSIAQQNVDVSSELQGIDFITQLGTMTGVVGGEKLMVTLTRNSTGTGADTYSGNARITGIELIKV